MREIPANKDWWGAAAPVTEDSATGRDQAAEDALGLTGARFGPRGLRRRRGVPPADLTTGESGPWRRRADEAPIGMSGARFGPLGARRRGGTGLPEATDLGLPAADATLTNLPVLTDTTAPELPDALSGPRPPLRPVPPEQRFPGERPVPPPMPMPRAAGPFTPPPRREHGIMITSGLTAAPIAGSVPISPVVVPPPAPPLFTTGPDLPSDLGLERTTEVSELGPDYSEGFGADLPVLVRPYIRTGGRTRGPADLGIETLVSVNPNGPEESLNPDHRAIVELCARPRSVAEVAAMNKMPIGVAKVLLADLARVGVIRVHSQAGTGGGPGQSNTGNHRPDLALMERVLAGLRKL
jgi:Protein of unknown function (DUF742)